MIFISTLITFLLFDDITASSISIIYHIHSDIPHHWITDILYTNHTISSNNKPNPSNPSNKKPKSKDYSLLNVFENGNNEIFVNGKSFSEIMHDHFRPNLQNLLPSMNNTTLYNINTNVNNNDDINKHLEWYSSKPIPYILQNKLNINKHHIVTTKLIYHPTLQHFILVVISQNCNNKNPINNKKHKHKQYNSNNNKWCIDIYERDAKPFLWQYAFDTKYLYQQKDNDNNKNNTSKHEVFEHKRKAFWDCIENFEFWNAFEYIVDLIVDDLKSIGIDISLGFDNLNELSHMLQEIILKESTQNPSFQNDGLKEEDLLKSNIEKYIFKKSEFYKSYYDVHADKIKIVYTDWYHTENIEINGVFIDKESLIKWSSDYKYLLINGYAFDYAQEYNISGYNERKTSELHLFEFEMKDNNNSITKMKNDESMKKHHLNNNKMSDDLLDKLEDYGYYKSSSLDKVYGIKLHQKSVKHVEGYDDHNMYAHMTAVAFSKCAVYYALENDYKIIRAVKLNELFDDIEIDYCNHEPEMMDEMMDETLAFFAGNEQNEQNESMSYYEHEDSLIELTRRLVACKDCISNDISDIMVINESTLLITQKTRYNSYFISYTTSLLHIPLTYQYIDQCGVDEYNRDEYRWYVIDRRHLYKDQLNSKQYYYRHENMQREIQHKEHKLDRLGSWMSSIHSTSSQIIANNLKSERKKENKLHFQPSLFLSKSQNGKSSIITSTPYFISLNNDKYSFDDTVEIVNIKSMTTFTRSALNKNGDLLAILDNTDSILVLKKNQHKPPPINPPINNMALFDDILSDKSKIESITQLSFNEFLVKTGIKSESDLSKILNNETMIDIISQFIRNELVEDKDNSDSHNDEVEWKVSVEFTATSIMSHLKPINIICISLDDEISKQNNIDGYVVVLFENGVISSYIIQNGMNTDYSQSGGSTFFLPNGAIDFWLETCIDWIELMFLMSFGLYFVCSCCRRSRVRIGLGRERVINAVDAAVNNDRPRRGAVDANNINNLQPLINQNNDNRPPLVLNDLAPNQQELQNANNNVRNDNNGNENENERKNDDELKDNNDDESDSISDIINDMNPSERAIKAALSRYLNQDVVMNGPIEMKEEQKEGKEEKEEKDEKHNDESGSGNEDIHQYVRIFDVPNTNENGNGNENANLNENNNRINVDLLSVNRDDDTEQSSPLSPLSPAINPSVNQSSIQ